MTRDELVELIKKNHEKWPDELADIIISEAPQILIEPSPFADTLHGDIRNVMYKWSQVEQSNIPDHVLASFLLGCLKEVNTAVRRQNAFFGFKPLAGDITDG